MAKIKLRTAAGQLTIEGVQVNAFENNGPKWDPLTNEDFFKLTVKDLLDSDRRILIHFVLHNMTIIITRSEEDRVKAQNKFKNACVVRIDQIVGFLKNELTQDKLAMFPRAFMCLSVFEGARIIS